MNQTKKTLLVKPTYKNSWEIPKKLIKIDKSPHAAAAREVIEELGLPQPIKQLLIID